VKRRPATRSLHSTVRSHRPPGGKTPPRLQPRVATPNLAARAPKRSTPKSQVGRILDDDSSLLDLIDNLLNKGVMLNADLILALADVDLIYIRLSALLCAADRVLPASAATSPRLHQGSVGQARRRRSGETPGRPRPK
jgi:hypothetical protein